MTGHIARRELRDRRWVTEQRRFLIRAERARHLDDIVAQSALWRYDTEYWESEELCFDGVDVFIERTTADGYRFSRANVPCKAPPQFLEVARELVDMAGLANSDVASWLE